MEPELLEILREAVETRQRKEELERSIGRALRRHELDFKIYVKMTSELREMTEREGISFEDAARRVLSQQ